MITKEMIKKGFDSGVVSIEEEYGGCTEICCKIGDNSFYFPENRICLTLEEYWENHTIENTIDALYTVLNTKQTAKDYGIYEGEWEYYNALLISIYNGK